MDVIICSKDRPSFLPTAINQVKSLIPYHTIIVVESSENPNLPLLESLDVKLILTPNVLLGVARQRGLQVASTDLIVFLDDDIIIEPDWFPKMKATLDLNPAALAVSSSIIYGSKSDSILEKLHRKSIRHTAGGSIGISLFKRKELLAIGGFNPLIHRGEDTELNLRMSSKGLKWIRAVHALAYHPLTMKEYLKKAKKNADGWILIWLHTHQRLSFIARAYGAALVMPIFYGLATLDLRVLFYYALYKYKILLTFLRTVKGGYNANS